MNSVTKAVLQAIESGKCDEAKELIDEFATLIGEGAARIRFYRLEDDIICRQSHSQAHFAGYISKAPFWKAPKDMTPNYGLLLRTLREIRDVCNGPAATRAELAHAIKESCNVIDAYQGIS